MERGNASPANEPTPEPTDAPPAPGGLVAPTGGSGGASTAPQSRGIPPEDRGPERDPGGSPIDTNPEDLNWEKIQAEVTGPGIDPNRDVGDSAIDANGNEWHRTRNPDGSTTSSLPGDGVNYEETVDKDGKRTRSFTESSGAGKSGWTESSDGRLVEWTENNYGDVHRNIVNSDGSRTVLPPDAPPLS